MQTILFSRNLSFNSFNLFKFMFLLSENAPFDYNLQHCVMQPGFQGKYLEKPACFPNNDATIAGYYPSEDIRD